MVREKREWMERMTPEAIMRLTTFLEYSEVRSGIRVVAKTQSEIKVVALLLSASALPSGLKMSEPIRVREKRIRGSD